MRRILVVVVLALVGLFVGGPAVASGGADGVVSKPSRARTDAGPPPVTTVPAVARANAPVNVYGAGARECTKRGWRVQVGVEVGDDPNFWSVIAETSGDRWAAGFWQDARAGFPNGTHRVGAVCQSADGTERGAEIGRGTIEVSAERADAGAELATPPVVRQGDVGTMFLVTLSRTCADPVVRVGPNPVEVRSVATPPRPLRPSMAKTRIEYTLPAGLDVGSYELAVSCAGSPLATQPLSVFPPKGTPEPAESSDLGDRSAVTDAVPLPSDIRTDPGAIGRTGLLGVVLVLLVGLPTELFNKTWEHHQGRIAAWWRRRTNRPADGGPGPLSWLVGSSPWHVGGYVLITAVLSTGVDPDAGWSVRSGLLSLAFLIAIPVILVAYQWPAERLTRRVTRVPAGFRTVPAALGLAVVCTAISRLAGFVPGLVFGLVAGFVALRERRVGRNQDGQAVLLGTLSCLVVSLLAWGGLELVHDRASATDAGTGWVLLDAVAATVFVLGVETLVFGLIPLRGTDGGRLRAWTPAGWAVVYTIVVLCFVHVLVLNPGGDASGPGGLIATLVVFGLASLAGFAFWAWFTYGPTPTPARPPAPLPPIPAPPGPPGFPIPAPPSAPPIPAPPPYPPGPPTGL
ncbi:FGLLP motif-containing membrane protein [Embleya scabrispora]|uniref:FGLLP motif-containing membrane protein n=1 Tax=Embleya scabrispora TaxID=159449 RepID=UPI0003A3C62F|nr:FGLLP motif-containing membrane protein [Embleya scabrispora]MYS80695.1 hypothetical protein [Streptomyces sp. SID5474]